MTQDERDETLNDIAIAAEKIVDLLTKLLDEVKDIARDMPEK